MTSRCRGRRRLRGGSPWSSEPRCRWIGTAIRLRCSRGRSSGDDGGWPRPRGCRRLRVRGRPSWCSGGSARTSQVVPPSTERKRRPPGRRLPRPVAATIVWESPSSAGTTTIRLTVNSRICSPPNLDQVDPVRRAHHTDGEGRDVVESLVVARPHEYAVAVAGIDGHRGRRLHRPSRAAGHPDPAAVGRLPDATRGAGDVHDGRVSGVDRDLVDAPAVRRKAEVHLARSEIARTHEPPQRTPGGWHAVPRRDPVGHHLGEDGGVRHGTYLTAPTFSSPPK